MGEDNSASSKYVNRDTVGYSDLDDYGTWKQDDTYGNVWYPNNIGPDWAPYSNGNWAYVAPWGWSWVGYEPWGFAPYHYGRWVYGGGYGAGHLDRSTPILSMGRRLLAGWAGLDLDFGFGFGWFPLGWGEPFHPWYHCGCGYYRGINVHNAYFHNFNGRPGGYRDFNYAYAHNTHAVTTASHNAFVNGQAINRGAQHLTEASLRGAQVTNGMHAVTDACQLTRRSEYGLSRGDSVEKRGESQRDGTQHAGSRRFAFAGSHHEFVGVCVARGELHLCTFDEHFRRFEQQPSV